MTNFFPVSRFKSAAWVLATTLTIAPWVGAAIASSTAVSPLSYTISQVTPGLPWATRAGTVITYTQVQGGHDRPVRAVAFSPDQQFLVTSGGDRTIKVWDLRHISTAPGSPSRVQNIVVDAGDREIVSLAFSPDGQLLASGSLGGTVRLWNWRTGELVRTLTGHRDVVSSLRFTPDGQTLASGSGDNTIRFWNVNTGTQEHLLETGQAVMKLTFSPDGKYLVTTGANRMVSLWEWQDDDEDEPERSSPVYSRSIQALAVSPDGELLAFSPDMQSPGGPAPEGNQEDYNSIHLLNSENFRQVGDPLRGHGDYITDLAFSPDGRILISTSLDTTIRLWDVEQQALIRTFEDEDSPVLTVAFRSDGRAFAIGRRDGTVRIFLAQD